MGTDPAFEPSFPEENAMRFMPIAAAFVIALVGGMAVGLRPGYSFGSLVMAATIVAAMTGLAASVLQFLPNRRFDLVAVIVGCVLGLLVPPMLAWAQVLGVGPVRGAASVVWPVAVVTALLISHGAGMQMPRLRGGRPGLPR
jgi:hypothetical protein